MVVRRQCFRRLDFHILAEGEDPVPEGRTFLNLDSGDAGVLVLADHLDLLSEFVIDDADELVGELQDSIFHRSAVHGEGLAGEVFGVGAVDDGAFSDRLFQGFGVLHAVQTVVGDAVVFGAEAHEVVVVVIHDQRHGLRDVLLFIFTVDVLQALVQIKIVEGQASML